MSIHSLLKMLLRNPPHPLLQPLLQPPEQESHPEEESKITARIIIHHELSLQPLLQPRLNAIYVTVLS